MLNRGALHALAQHTHSDAKWFAKQHPIHQAIYARNLDKVKSMIKEDATLLEKKDDAGYTPLLQASKYAEGDMIDWLLDQGANIDAVEDVGRTS